MTKNLLDGRWVFDPGNEFNLIAELTTGFNVDIENAFSPKADVEVSVN